MAPLPAVMPPELAEALLGVERQADEVHETIELLFGLCGGALGQQELVARVREGLRRVEAAIDDARGAIEESDHEAIRREASDRLRKLEERYNA